MSRFRFYSWVDVPMDARFWACVVVGLVVGCTAPGVVL